MSRRVEGDIPLDAYTELAARARRMAHDAGDIRKGHAGNAATG